MFLQPSVSLRFVNLAAKLKANKFVVSIQICGISWNKEILL